MHIKKIYSSFHIPLTLQQHMLTVAAVGKYIADHWRGPAIDAEAVIATLLVHDLGNLVKFDLSENALVIDQTLFTDEWRERQRVMRETYGAHSHQVTLAMLKELGLPENIRTLADGMDADDLCIFLDSSFEQQICEYADIRVTPDGVVSLRERLADFRRRYAHYEGWSSEERYQRNLTCAEQLETALQKHTSVDITDIPAEKIQAYLVELSQFEIPTGSA